MTEIPEGWIKHDGGPCPVSEVSQPSVILRDGEHYSGIWACNMIWEHDGRGDDIIAYKVETNA